jgi:hypothetical protein
LVRLYLEGRLEATLGVLVSRQGRRVHQGHPRDCLVDRPGLDDGVVPVGVGDEDDALVLLLSDARIALLGGLGLALEAEMLLLAAAREVGLGDLGREGADVRGLVRGGLGLSEAAVLGLAGGRLGALLGILLPAARGTGLGALGLLPILSAGSTDGSVVEVAQSMRDAMEDSAAIDEEDNGENDSAHGLRSVYRQVRGLGYLQLKEYFQKTHFPKMSMDGLKKMNFNCCSILRFFPPPSPDVSGSSTVPHHLVAPLGGGHWGAGHLRVPAPRRGLHRRHLAAAPVRCGAKAAAPPVDEEEEASTLGTAASRACSVACSWTRTPPTPRTTDSSTSPMPCRAMSWPTRTWRMTL